MNNYKDTENNEKADLLSNDSDLVSYSTKIVKEELEPVNERKQSNLTTEAKQKPTQSVKENYQRQTKKWECVRVFKASIAKRFSCLTFAITLDGKTFISRDDDSFIIQIWDIQTGNLNHEINVKDIVDSSDKIKIIISSDSLYFAYSTSNTVNVYYLSTAKLIHSFVCSEKVLDIFFSPDGRIIASMNNVSKLWDIHSGEESHAYEGFITVSLDWNIFIAFDYLEDDSEVIRINYLKTNKNINSIYIEDKYCLLTLPILSASGRFISCSGIYKPIFSNDQNFTQIWDCYTGETLYKLITSNEIESVLFSLDEELFTVVLWNESEKRKIVEVRTTLSREIVSRFDVNKVDDIKISLDGQNLIAFNGKEIKIWHLTSKELLFTFTLRRSFLENFAFSSDERTLVISCRNAEIMILQQNNDSSVEVAKEPLSGITGEKFVIGGTATWYRTNSNGDVDLFIERVIILATTSEHIVIEANIDGQKIVYFALPDDLGFRSPIKIEQFEVKP